MKLVEGLEQSSERWYEYRLKKIMASDSAIISGDMKRFGKTPLKLWHEKITGEYEIVTNPNIERGKQLEGIAREHFTMLTSLDIFPAVIEHDENDWAAASLDGLSYDHKNIVEIKVHNEVTYSKTLNGYIPEYYAAQFQKQLYVSNLDWLYYFPFDGTHGHIVKIYRDDKYIEKMIERERAFWDAICNLEPPEECDEDFTTIDNPVFTELAKAYLDVKNKISMLKLQEEEIKQELVMRADNRNCKGGGIKMLKIMRRGNIDYKSVPCLQDVDLNQYRKDSIEFWQIKEIA